MSRVAHERDWLFPGDGEVSPSLSSFPTPELLCIYCLDSKPCSSWAPEENLASIPWGRGRHRGTQASPFIYVLCVHALMLQGQDWVLVTESIWHEKPKILTLWPSAEKFCPNWGILCIWWLDFSLTHLEWLCYVSSLGQWRNSHASHFLYSVIQKWHKWFFFSQVILEPAELKSGSESWFFSVLSWTHPPRASLLLSWQGESKSSPLHTFPSAVTLLCASLPSKPGAKFLPLPVAWLFSRESFSFLQCRVDQSHCTSQWAVYIASALLHHVYLCPLSSLGWIFIPHGFLGSCFSIRVKFSPFGSLVV